MPVPRLLSRLHDLPHLSIQNREQAERDKQRLQAEEQAQREIKKSNDAVNEVSKKLGKKPPALDLGLPADPKAAPPPADTKTSPAPKS